MTYITSTSGYNSQIQYNNDASQQSSKAAKAASNGYGTSAKASNASSMQSMMLSQLLGSYGIGANDSMSFNDILGLRDTMKDTINSRVRNDLRELGVGIDKAAYQDVRGKAFDLGMKVELEKLGVTGDYKLESDGKGGVNVVAENEDTRKAIEDYLAKNPDKVKEFNKIKNPTRNDMVAYRDEMEKDIEKSLREFLDKQGLNSKAPFDLTQKNGQVVVTSSDSKVKAALDEYFKDNPDAAKEFKAVDKMTDTNAVKFQLTFSKDGKPVVVSNHPDKALIQSYFDTNPDVTKQFKQMDSLNTVDQARKAQDFKPSDIRKRIQMESLSTWFANTGMGTSSIMDFNGGTTSLLNGLNRVV